MYVYEDVVCLYIGGHVSGYSLMSTWLKLARSRCSPVWINCLLCDLGQVIQPLRKCEYILWWQKEELKIKASMAPYIYLSQTLSWFLFVIWSTLEPGLKPWSFFLIMFIFSVNVASMDSEFFIAEII